MSNKTRYTLNLNNYGTNVTLSADKSEFSVRIPNYITAKGACNIRVVSAHIENFRYDTVTSAIKYLIREADTDKMSPFLECNINSLGIDSNDAGPTVLFQSQTNITREIHSNGSGNTTDVNPDSFQSLQVPYEFTCAAGLPPVITIARKYVKNNGTTAPLSLVVGENVLLVPVSVRLEVCFDEDY